MLSDYHPINFAIRLWDGTTWGPELGEQIQCTITLHHPGSLRKMFFPLNDLSLGEAYIHDDFSIEGDWNAIFKFADQLTRQKRSILEYARIGWQLLRLPILDDSAKRAERDRANLSGQVHSKQRDKEAISYHYDVSNEFYELWLDKNMVYSCGYFTAPDQNIDIAQINKLDHICRKLRLKPGDTLLDIGCGWGGLVMHATKYYGVKALGITLSKLQAEYAQQRIIDAGLQDQCRVEVRDYRDFHNEEKFDKLVSVGMFEHVGLNNLPIYFSQAWKLLNLGGVFLNHGIASDINRPIETSPFLRKYVFPDGEIVYLDTTAKLARDAGFEIRDVENLREHYSLTLGHWVKRLRANEAKAIEMVGSVTYRIWELYMIGSLYGFDTRVQTIYQVLLSKPDNNDTRLPLTRADWYK